MAALSAGVAGTQWLDVSLKIKLQLVVPVLVILVGILFRQEQEVWLRCSVAVDVVVVAAANCCAHGCYCSCILTYSSTTAHHAKAV